MTLNELKSKGDLDPSVLSHRILIKRTDRPDEWSMDELARKALELENQNKDLLKKFYYVSKELEESKRENEKLKAENERLKVRELKTYHDGYKDGLTACNTVGAEEALEDRDFHYCKWVEKKEKGE